MTINNFLAGVIVLIFCICAVALAMSPFVRFGSAEQGWHSGYIVDVSEQGWFCKTLEATIMSGSGNSAVKYDVTVVNNDTFKKLVQALTDRVEVDVHYFSPRFYWRCTSSHANLVDGVRAKR